MRMRTIEEGYNEIKEKDPETSLTKNAWRSLIKRGIIPSVAFGKKRLVNMDAVELYFLGDNYQPVIKNNFYGDERAAQ